MKTNLNKSDGHRYKADAHKILQNFDLLRH